MEQLSSDNFLPKHTKLREQLWTCLKVEWTATTYASLAHLSTEEWADLFALARQQGILPLLWQRIQSSGHQHLIPTTVSQPVQERVYTETLRNLRLYHELGLILASLRAEKIQVIVLKGVHLAATVYPNQALRYMHDIDLLFRPADVPAAVAVLHALEYQPDAPIVWAKHLATEHHLPRFGKPDVVAGVEIHWTITHPKQSYTITLDELWSRVVPVTLAGVEVLGLCPEDLLLHICEHATYHHQCLQRMRFLCDIDALVRHYGGSLDWAQVQQRAQDYHWAKGVHLALLLAQQLLATPVPSTVLRQLQTDGFNAQLTNLAIDLFFTEQTITASVSYDFAKLSMATSWAEKAKIIGRRLWLPRQIVAHAYAIPRQSPKLYFYYLVHYKNLLLRYSGKLWRLWRKDPVLLCIISSNLALTDRKTALSQWLEQP